jgi:hypothetical protein
MIRVTTNMARAAANIFDRRQQKIERGKAVHRHSSVNRTVAGKPTAACPRSILLASKSL